MIAFGIMTLIPDSEVSYLTEIAKSAKDFGMECCRFIPSQINPHTQSVRGKKFDSKTTQWVDDEFPIPTILYDRCFYGDDEHSKQCLPIVSWLKSRNDITFLGYGLPNKLELYDSLKNTVLAPYLPPTLAASNSDIILKELEAKEKIILKPINGSQGHGIYYVKKNDKTYHVKTEKQKQIISRIFPNKAKLLKWLKPLITARKYLLQPYLELFNKEHQPFDIRILLQKDEKGFWCERGRGIRFGTTGGILSNLSAGGSAAAFSEWTATLPPKAVEYMCSELDYILDKLPILLEHEYLPLFEIGVDIGIAKNGSIWILDLNSKPGRKVIFQTTPGINETLYQAPLIYAKHLYGMEQQERKSIYEKTLSH
ncbi:YheC/YheD family endospore coat-associated protein [Neobacillus kokaensis]|uniref:Endospore coat-associated protein YheC n=1 Tax=Neobacillus kokaensis TaxID=2759023 RepID=A0ABQ3N1L9_9BACI|nr:YheC/YheD family protein [Neobacillus kokaensis]GHH98567.1 endospore coat-associated protein YheC [Neobacillus kokaensis]